MSVKAGDVIRPRPSKKEEIVGEFFIYPVWSNGKDNNYWEPAIDIQTGWANCDCPDFSITLEKQARLSGLQPSIWTPQILCKHILWLRELLKRQGRIAFDAELDEE
jgi:hypothetical protein